MLSDTTMDDSCIEVPVDLSTSLPTKMKGELIMDEKGSDCESSSGRGSPENNCPICLGKPRNKSFTDSCLHQFCFNCLLEWSKVKAECPLCKQGFKSIIHNVRSIEDYEQYYLSTHLSAEKGYMGAFIQPRDAFRYRTTAVSTYLDYFVRLEEVINHHHLPPASPQTGATHWQRRRQHGTSDFRRNIYQQGLWAQSPRDCTGAVRECSPEFYRLNPAQVHRLVPWLNRELNVVCNNNEAVVQLVLSRILELIKQVSIRSREFNAEVAPYVGRHTQHFVHELYSFASSPYDLVGYDRHANYVTHNSSMNLPDSSDDTSNDSDVQIVGQFTATSPLHSIQLDSHDSSDSDECVVVDSLPPPPVSPEIITLESEEEVVHVNIRIGGTDSSQQGTSRRAPLKRSWLTVRNLQVPTSSNENNVNVSINIHGRPQNSDHGGTSSSEEWSPSRKKAKIKTKRKKLKERKSTKSKCSKKRMKKSNLKRRVSEESSSCEDGLWVSLKRKLSEMSSSESSSEDDLWVSCKRRRPIPIKSDSEVEPIDTVPSHVASDQYQETSSDEDYKPPRMRSVVVRSLKRPSSQWLGADSYPASNPDPESSHASLSDRYHGRSYSPLSPEPPNKKHKHSKRRS